MKMLLAISLLVLAFTASAQKWVLSGMVSDAQNGETLVGATVVSADGKGTTTNAHGFFSLPGLNSEALTIKVSFIGYETKNLLVEAKTGGVFLTVSLHPADVELGQVTVVESARDRLGDSPVEISQHLLTPKVIRSIPTARNDVFRALKYLPGIENTEPMSPLVSVRGSDPGENLIMLDGVTIYNPYHFMSSSGIFNMQTVKHVDMMAGGFGAEYGGRNSAVINIATRDGNDRELHGEVQPSTAESKVFLEFPLGERSTMMVAGRVNYDLIGNFMLYSNNYFYDANLSFTHRFSPKTRLSLKYFSSRDRTKLDFNSYYRYIGNTMNNEIGEILNDMSLKWINHWSNHIATAIFHSALGPRLFLRAQLSGSFHRADNETEMMMKVENVAFDTSTRFRSRVNDATAKASLEFKPFVWNVLKIGGEYKLYHFFNGSEVNRVENPSASRNPVEKAFFAEDKVSWGPLVLRTGVRMNRFEQGKIWYEPRFNAVLNLPGSWKVQAAWGQYLQHIISMNTQEFEFNQFLDYYYPLNNDLPGASTHYVFGLEKQVGSSHQLGIDLYYKDLTRTYAFDLLQSSYEAFALSEKIMAGTGQSYGMEVLWRGDFGKLSGWAGYTLARSTRSFPHIMEGKTYDYDYERRHSFKGVLNYQAGSRVEYSAAWKIQSGTPRSIEHTLQMYYLYDPLTGTMIYSPQYTVDVKNGARMPWLFYLDFGLQKQLVTGFGKQLAEFFNASESYLTVNVYNALFFRRNVLYYVVMGLPDTPYLPLGDNYLPTVSAGYTIKF